MSKMSEARRRSVSVLVALVAFVILTPNLVTIVQQVWQTYVQPPAFGYDYKVSVPQCSGVAEGDMQGYHGVQKYKLPGLSVIYQIVDSIPSPQNILLSIKLERDQVTIGNNVTFLITITFTRAEDRRELALYVFLSDPRGIVRGAFPDGKIPTPMPAPVYPYLSYYNIMQQGRLAFTFRIPQDSLSVGDWTIFALGTGYLPVAPIGPFIAWNAITFKAAEPPRVEHAMTPILDTLRSFGIFFAVYGFVNNYFENLVAGLKTLRKNWAFLIGLCLIIGYIALALVFQR
jgi:hypothetical protein